MRQPTLKSILDWPNGLDGMLACLDHGLWTEPITPPLRLTANLHQTDVAKPLHYSQHFFSVSEGFAFDPFSTTARLAWLKPAAVLTFPIRLLKDFFPRHRRWCADRHASFSSLRTTGLRTGYKDPSKHCTRVLPPQHGQPRHTGFGRTANSIGLQVDVHPVTR